MVAKLDTLVKVTVVDFISASSAQYSMNHLLDYDLFTFLDAVDANSLYI